MSSRLPVVILTVLVLSFLLLMMAFRSLLLPLKAIIMNLLSVGAAYGLMTAVFQWGWGQRLLGFTSEGNISTFIPMFLFCILFGLSMDYEVFLMTRIREEYHKTGSNELAVAHGLESSARAITSAALIMVTVFAAFATSRLVPFKADGLRAGRRGSDRRDDRADHPGPGRDEADGRLELVDADVARPDPPPHRARDRGRRGAGRPNHNSSPPRQHTPHDPHDRGRVR